MLKLNNFFYNYTFDDYNEKSSEKNFKIFLRDIESKISILFFIGLFFPISLCFLIIFKIIDVIFLLFFIPFFFDPDPPKKFVRPINPLPLLSNRRLVVQQGVFICPGDIRSSFNENLQALDGWDKENNVFRIEFKFTKNERNKALRELYRMNVNRAALFPGIDGFAASLEHKIAIYCQLTK